MCTQERLERELKQLREMLALTQSAQHEAQQSLNGARDMLIHMQQEIMVRAHIGSAREQRSLLRPLPPPHSSVRVCGVGLQSSTGLKVRMAEFAQRVDRYKRDVSHLSDQLHKAGYKPEVS